MTSATLSHPTPSRIDPRVVLPSAVAATILGLACLTLISFAVALPIALDQAESGRLAVSDAELTSARRLTGLWPVLALGGLLQGIGAVGAIDRRSLGRLVAILAAGLGGAAMILSLMSIGGGRDLAVLGTVAAAYVIATGAATAIRSRGPERPEPFDDSRMPW